MLITAHLPRSFLATIHFHLNNKKKATVTWGHDSVSLLGTTNHWVAGELVVPLGLGPGAVALTINNDDDEPSSAAAASAAYDQAQAFLATRPDADSTTASP